MTVSTATCPRPAGGAGAATAAGPAAPRSRASAGSRTGRPRSTDARRSGTGRADLLIFRKEHGKANVTSLMERKSRFTFLLPNDDRRSAAVLAGIAGALRRAARGGAADRHLRPRQRVRGLRRPRPPSRPGELLLRPAQPLAEGRRRERERPGAPLPAARGRARGARPRPPPPARRPAQRHAPPLPRLPYPARGLPGAPGRPDRAALTSPPHLSHFA